MLGSPKRDPVRFGFLKTREPRVKFWVGFGPDPALIDSGFEYLKIYEGGSEYADLVKNITGIHAQTNVSVPGNQMFVKFETSSKVARKGFRAYIHRIGNLISLEKICKFSKQAKR